MKTYTVVFSLPAEADLEAIHDYIAGRAGSALALKFIEGIESYCLGFSDAPERGTRRDDLRRGLRTVGFRRRATILFEVEPMRKRVVILGVYYAGRNFENDDETGQTTPPE